MSQTKRQRVLITGASSGIGLQLVHDYAAAGWEVLASGRNADKLADSCGAVAAQLLVADSSDRDAVLSTFADIGELDLAILNAGTCEYIDDARHFDSALFKRVIDTNLNGTAYCLEALLPQLPRGSRIALMSSTSTLLPFSRAEAYGASKAAMDYLANSLRIDLRRHGIAVSLIRPCFVDTPLTARNTFAMPGIISVTRASAIIRRQLARGRDEINFTRPFVAFLRLVAWLPSALNNRLQGGKQRL